SLPLPAAPDAWRSGGHAARVRPNAALTSFAAWFGNALRAAEPGCFTCRGGRQAFGLPSPAQVSAALGGIHHSDGFHMNRFRQLVLRNFWWLGMIAASSLLAVHSLGVRVITVDTTSLFL